MKDYEIKNTIDAFLTLNDIDDEDVLGMIKTVNRKKKFNEGKSFSISNGATLDLEAADKFLHKHETDPEIEVIDVDADTLNHVKDKEDYVGQAIISCNKCKANRFIDMNKLVVDNNDDTLYNTEDECPHCNAKGSGYELIGQVGKVAEEQPAENTPNLDSLVNDEEVPEIENDLANDEVAFDNNMEEAPEVPEDAEPAQPATITQEPEDLPEPKEKKIIFKDEEENDGMETTATDDEDTDLPDLGEEYKEEFSDDNDEELSEGFLRAMNLVEKEGENPYAHEAWMMNKVISSMNNEEAYYNAWLYVWPDGETREECEYDFGDKDSLEDLKQEFIKTYKYYHRDGLYNAEPEVEAYANKWDNILELQPVNNIKPDIKNEELNEADTEEETEESFLVANFFDLVIDPEKMENIQINGYEGSYEEAPEELLNLNLISFNTADSNFVINAVAAEGDEEDPLTVADLLEFYDNEETEKISVVDAIEFEELILGTKADVIAKCGDMIVQSIEKPEIIVITGIDEAVDEAASEEEPAEAEAPVDESLFERICKANNLASYRVNNPASTEHWINESLNDKFDLDLLYEKFIKGHDLKLVTEFKITTGYKDKVNEGFNNEQFEEYMDLCAALDLKTGADIAKFARDHGNVQDEDLLDALRIEFMNREEAKQTAETPNQVKRYNDDKFELSVDGGETWEECSEEEFDEVPYEDVSETLDEEANESEQKTEEEVIESVQSFATRKELSEAIKEYQKNNRPYIVKRSVKEGYRFDLCEMLAPNEIAPEEVETVDIDDIIDAPEASEETAVAPADLSLEEIDVLSKINRIANDICEAVEKYYNIEASPALVVADILQDLRLISGTLDVEDLEDTPINNATKAMFQDYKAGYELVNTILVEMGEEPFDTTPSALLADAIKTLDSPAFSKETIERGIASDRFIAAVERGQIPYLAPNMVPQLTEALTKFNEACNCEESVNTVDDNYEFNLEDDEDRDYVAKFFRDNLVPDEIEYVDVDVVVGYEPAVQHLANGDPGYPAEPIEGTADWRYKYEELNEDSIIDDAIKFISEKYPEKFTLGDLKAIKFDDYYNYLKDKYEEDALEDAYQNYDSNDYQEPEYDEPEYDYDESLKSQSLEEEVDDEESYNKYHDPNYKFDFSDGDDWEQIYDYLAFHDYIPTKLEYEDLPVSVSTGTRSFSSYYGSQPCYDDDYDNIEIDITYPFAQEVPAEDVGDKIGNFIEKKYPNGFTVEDLRNFKKNHENEFYEFLKKEFKEKATNWAQDHYEPYYYESVEVDTEKFDKEINEYFDANYEDTLVYVTESGKVTSDGSIILEGWIKNEEVEKPVTFTFTPMKKLNESLETAEDVAKVLGVVDYKVTNNLSEEVFEFRFVNDTSNSEIFKMKEEEKKDIIDKFLKQEKDITKYLNAREIVKACAEWEYSQNKSKYDKLGVDICHIENLLLDVIADIDVEPLIENGEPEDK